MNNNNKNYNRHAAAASERHRDNNQGILYISAGIPGSGKTTFLNKTAKKEEVVVSRDTIRFGILKEGEAYFSHEEEVFEMFADTIAGYISAGKNVYADATHLTPVSQIKLLSRVLLDSAPAAIEYIYFDVPLEICFERNELRKGTKAYVPQNIIRNMYKNADFSPCSFIDRCWIVDKNGNVSKGEIEKK